MWLKSVGAQLGTVAWPKTWRAQLQGPKKSMVIFPPGTGGENLLRGTTPCHAERKTFLSRVGDCTGRAVRMLSCESDSETLKNLTP